jgi:hypothetical protein
MARDIAMPHQTLVERIRAEFLEMPGLQLTLEQAQRFWGIDRAACRQVFDSLIEIGFLCVRPNGMYGRVTEGIDRLHPKPVKAILKIDNPERRAS